MSGAPPNTVSASLHLHLAPSYALDPPPSPFPSSSASAAPPGRQTSKSLRPYSQDELRQLVFDYLCHSGYLDSAKAFATQINEADGGGEGGHERDTGAAGAMANGDSSTTMNGDGGDAMEGVEATPEPESNGLKKENGFGGGPLVANGKSVAFEEGAADGLDEDDEACGVLSKEDLKDVRLRRNIRDAILTGRVSYAVDLLNEHYPAVLSSPPSSEAPTPSKLSHYGVSPPAPPSCTPQTFFVASPPPSSALPAPSGFATPSYLPVTGSTFEPWARSLSPAILSLNLQTQAFIEHMRHAHASGTMSAPSTPTSSVLNGHTPRPHAAADDGSDAGMSGSTSSLGGSSLLNVAIAQSQALREKVLKLPPGKEREGWEKESIDVCGLLAYKDLNSCPVRGYLAQSRREILAEMVNGAIMQQTSRTPLPLLALAVRQTTAFWSTLCEMRVPFPPSASPSTGRDKDSKNKAPKTYPAFDLHTFLAEREPAPAAYGATPSGAMQTE
ncbi:hypothetical protein JCM10213_006427 [Rhodosporidiobolus nylandii]